MLSLVLTLMVQVKSADEMSSPVAPASVLAKRLASTEAGATGENAAVHPNRVRITEGYASHIPQERA